MDISEGLTLLAVFYIPSARTGELRNFSLAGFAIQARVLCFQLLVAHK